MAFGWRDEYSPPPTMIHNDVLRSVRYRLNVSEKKMIEIFAIADCAVTPAEMSSYLKREDEPGFAECPDAAMARFLNALVIFKRGRDETRPAPPIEVPVTNNIVLKKLRVAFELKDDDILAIMRKSGFFVPKAELSAFFRNPAHRNYRECGDQFLRNFIRGLS